VLAATFMVVLPSTAFAGHDLGIYKVEKQLDLDSDETAIDLSCNGTDLALDGMWRVDHIDQDDDDLYKTAIGRAVDVLEAYPSTQSNYHFLFEKNGIGRAQVKVFATCIKDKTEQSGGHQHNVQITSYSSTAKPAVNSWYGNSFSTSSDANKCTGQTFVSTPGFKIDWLNKGTGADPSPYIGRMSTSWMSPDIKTYAWTHNFAGEPATTTITYYWSCVKRKVQTAGGENHKLVYRLNSTPSPQSDSIPATSIKTVRQSCQSHYKAVVAGFSFTPGGPIADLNPNVVDPAPWLWFLGMDPQPKSRDFRFLNGDASAHSVLTQAICLNYRTT
jgi:hypothetical protein